MQAMNYYGALEKYNVMVSSSNFSEVSSFLPGIKSLATTIGHAAQSIILN